MPRYTEEQKRKFLDLVAGGSSLKAAAAAAGISMATAVKLRMAENKKTTAPAAPKPAKGEEENLSEGDVPAPGPGGGGAKAGSGAGGAAAARKALVDGVEVPLETEPEEDGPEAESVPEAPKLDSARLLIDLSKMLTYGMVKGYAIRHKVKLTGELRESLRWTKQEEQELMEYAPAAAAMMPGMLLLLGPYLAPVFYGWGLYQVIAAKFSMVKEQAPGKKKPAGRKEVEEEEITEEDPLPNGYRPTVASTPETAEELFRNSYWNTKGNS